MMERKSVGMIKDMEKNVPKPPTRLYCVPVGQPSSSHDISDPVPVGQPAANDPWKDAGHRWLAASLLSIAVVPV